MRLVFVCQGCGCHYFPPVGLVWPDGARASAVWCAGCRTEAAERGIEEPAELAAVAMMLAVRAYQAALAARLQREQAERPDRRPSRPARTARGQLRPGGARTRLG
ncbi:hypothetical protein GCM10010441_59440 [Kitasatospora paracochleata]|uniref:Uncharacterized protein n=1 Tax=Kitasatospora paracochleata TaxID=58354 RepID=A0ABT1J299_9ACTN|nr:hypothetical protein [Kitasatospora paracochleata]MCP2311206.1 hypothetical protein [Kitasatospora paracochleata]